MPVVAGIFEAQCIGKKVKYELKGFTASCTGFDDCKSLC